MSPLIRQFLSRTVVRSLVKKGYSLDLTLKDLKIKDIDLRLQNLKLDRFRNLFSSSSAGSASASPLIPPVHEIAPLPSAMPTPRLGEEGSPAPAGKKKDAVLTDTQIEDAIGLLFEYFEETFATLKGTLSDAGAYDHRHLATVAID